ncbi:MAG: CvpA family protein [Candidatus Marinimicrobia bacterium]|nr:CvpA family protein [Candidatus Neomarinimicrobiota bacterium]
MFSVFDIICLAVFGIFIFLGYRRGLIGEASKLVGVVLGIYLAVTKYQALSLYFKNFFESNPGIRMVISFLLIFLLVYFAIQFVGHIIGSTLQKLHLSWINRSLGGFFGALKALLIMVIIVWIMGSFQDLKVDKKLRGSSISYMFLKDVQQYLSKTFNIEKELEAMNKKLREMFMLNDNRNENSI